jgi:hypothetical protein
LEQRLADRAARDAAADLQLALGWQALARLELTTGDARGDVVAHADILEALGVLHRLTWTAVESRLGARMGGRSPRVKELDQTNAASADPRR